MYLIAPDFDKPTLTIRKLSLYHASTDNSGTPMRLITAGPPGIVIFAKTLLSKVEELTNPTQNDIDQAKENLRRYLASSGMKLPLFRQAILSEIDQYIPGIARTWTLYGYWIDDEIVITETKAGNWADHRNQNVPFDTWCEPVTGTDLESLIQKAKAHYETSGR